MPKRIGFSYYPWISQYKSAVELKTSITAFVGLLNKHLREIEGDQFQIDPPIVQEVPDQLAYLREPPKDDMVGKIGLLNPLGYALVHEAEPAVKAVAVILRKVGKNPTGPTYKAQIYTHKLSGITKLEEVRDRIMAFGSRQSTSNFLVPAWQLLQAGIHPFTAFRRIEFAGGHDTVALGVYKRWFDVGAGHDGAILKLKSQPGYEDAEEQLVRLAWSDDIPSDPVAVKSSDDEVYRQVARALIAVAAPNAKESPGNLLVKEFWDTVEGFAEIDPETYAGLLVFMRKFGLELADVMPRR